MRTHLSKFSMVYAAAFTSMLVIGAPQAQAKGKHLERISTTRSGSISATKASTKSKSKAKSKSKSSSKRVSKKSSNKSHDLSTDLVFDGAMVNGKYLSAGEAVSIVETEKQMNKLVGLRIDFKDRLANEQARLKSGIVAKSAKGQ